MSIILPKLPKVDYDAGWHRQYTADQLRARDLEVARLVLKAAADLVDDNAAYCSGQTAAILAANADAIREMEVRHHE